MVFLLTVCFAVLADQATKTAVRGTMQVGDRVEFVPGLVDILYVRNDGAAFSLGSGMGWLFVIVAAAVAVGALVMVWRDELPYWLVAVIGCVAGGGVGNMIDRIAMGYVTDFLALDFVDFPVFNVADILVTCGVVVAFAGYCAWDSRRLRDAEASREAGPNRTDGADEGRHEGRMSVGDGAGAGE